MDRAAYLQALSDAGVTQQSTPTLWPSPRDREGDRLAGPSCAQKEKIATEDEVNEWVVQSSQGLDAGEDSVGPAETGRRSTVPRNLRLAAELASQPKPRFSPRTVQVYEALRELVVATDEQLTNH